MSIRKYLIIPSVLACDILLIDRLTKLFALHSCADEWIVTQFVSCHLTFNRGISWGMFHQASGSVFWLITALIAMITVYIAYLGWLRIKEGEWAIGYVCVVAGSISNLIDRVIYGGVVDFIAFSFAGWEFPVFNVADICIVGGVMMIAMNLSFDTPRLARHSGRTEKDVSQKNKKI